MNLQDEINKAKELLNQLEDKQAKELLNPKSKRVLIKGGSAYGVSASGDTYKYPTHCVIETIENDNAFIDEESAQLQAQRNKLVHKMRLAAADSPPVDWSESQGKHTLAWDIVSNSYFVHSTYDNRYSQLPHFSNRSKLEVFMNTLSTQEQKLLVVGVE